ncbi:hypothetical protein ACFGVR_02740 [Mucilaginibacter sp. AW1-3]
MSIFKSDSDLVFNQAKWENELSPVKSFTASKSIRESFVNTSIADPNQFILLQLSDGDKRILNTSEVVPKLAGSDKPDINMLLDFEGFKIGSNEDVDKDTKATLQLQVGQEEKIGPLEKLFYCINGGLDLYNEIKGSKTESKDFKKSTDQALGNKPISLPGGIGQISLKVVKHEEQQWWQKVFSFAKSDQAKDLFSLIGFPGITETAVNCVSGMLDSLFDKAPEVLFQSQPVKLGFTQTAKDELGGGLTTNFVSCLNPGFWLMARKADYDEIINSKPVYYGGYGILAPDGMSEIDALRDSRNNPFSKITYAVIRARMKEVDLQQGMF